VETRIKKGGTMIRVIFRYDEPTRKWESSVEGATSALEATQAFNAVIITCQQLDPQLLTHTLATLNQDETNDLYEIIPAV
jgi:hypothetical protein